MEYVVYPTYKEVCVQLNLLADCVNYPFSQFVSKNLRR